MKNTFGFSRRANLPIVWTRSTCPHSHDIQCLVPCLVCPSSQLPRQRSAGENRGTMSCLPMFLRGREGGSACTTWPRRLLRLAAGAPNPARFCMWTCERGQGLVTSPHSRRQALAWGATHLGLNGVRPRSEALSVGLQRPPLGRGEGKARRGQDGILAS